LADRIVVGYFGDRTSLAEAVRAAAVRGMDVVAVAFDLGGHTGLGALRDDALTLGAIRCHALDLREEFARDVMVPALRAHLADPHRSVSFLAEAFVVRTLESIARLESATVAEPRGIEVPWTAQPPGRSAEGVANISLRFAEGAPVELNEIPMMLTEILESLETITGRPAADVLQAAYRELESSPDGMVELRADCGTIDVMPRLVAS
jgi:argininosuccinate synthase